MSWIDGGNLKCDVVIPTFNRGELLLRALKSVLLQADCVGKIVIANNGDPIPQDIVSQIPSRIFLLNLPRAIGASAARNAGAALCSGSFIAFLDDDDYWDAGYLMHALPVFNRGADIVVGRLMRKAEGFPPINYKLLNDGKDGLRRLYYSNPGFGGQNIIVRRSIFERLGGFDSSLPASNDRDFAVRALQLGATILAQPSSIAILCDHSGERVRHKQVVGNYLFIKKHWRHMRVIELVKAVYTLAKRFFKVKLGR